MPRWELSSFPLYLVIFGKKEKDEKGCQQRAASAERSWETYGGVEEKASAIKKCPHL